MDSSRHPTQESSACKEQGEDKLCLHVWARKRQSGTVARKNHTHSLQSFSELQHTHFQNRAPCTVPAHVVENGNNAPSHMCPTTPMMSPVFKNRLGAPPPFLALSAPARTLSVHDHPRDPSLYETQRQFEHWTDFSLFATQVAHPVKKQLTDASMWIRP